MNNEKMTVLVVDDATENIDVIVGLLKEHYKVKAATNGFKALKIIESKPPDLVLLDIMMPEIDGYEVIKSIKANPQTADIPVIFLTGKTDVSDETTGFELGAVDYISKPFNPLVVKARVKTHIELVRQRRKTEILLASILPEKVIKDLKNVGFSKPDVFENVSVLFSDFVGFTNMSTNMKPEILIGELSEIFTAFDSIIEKNQCERIKTIGDAYLAVCGMPTENPAHAECITNSGLEMLKYLEARNKTSEFIWQCRIGIHSGPVVGGIVGVKKYIYDIFGDTVNTASRIEGASEAMKLSVSHTTYELIKNKFHCISRGQVLLKGKGDTALYFVNMDQ
jgi:CheY-like chemotaxis protein